MKSEGFTVDSNAMKGIAIIMMLFHHMFMNTDLVRKYDVNFLIFSEYNITNLAQTFKICVSIFAFITGYGLYLNYKKRTISHIRWIDSRLIKLLSGYWFIWILSNMITLFIDGRPIKFYFSKGIWEGIANIVVDFLGCAQLFGSVTLLDAWWYMSAAIIFVILIPQIMKQEQYLFTIIFLLIALPRLLNVEFLGTRSPYYFILPYLYGILFAKCNVIGKWKGYFKRNIYLKFFIEVFIMFIGYRLYRYLPLKKYWDFHWGIFPVIIIIFSSEFIIEIPFIGRVLQVLGKYSANIYLIHNFIRGVYLKNFIYEKSNFVISFMLLLVISFVMSLIIELIKYVVRYDKLIDMVCREIEEKV